MIPYKLYLPSHNVSIYLLLQNWYTTHVMCNMRSIHCTILDSMYSRQWCIIVVYWWKMHCIFYIENSFLVSCNTIAMNGVNASSPGHEKCQYVNMSKRRWRWSWRWRQKSGKQMQGKREQGAARFNDFELMITW